MGVTSGDKRVKASQHGHKCAQPWRTGTICIMGNSKVQVVQGEKDIRPVPQIYAVQGAPDGQASARSRPTLTHGSRGILAEQ